jgi:hypothetical protein
VRPASAGEERRSDCDSSVGRGAERVQTQKGSADHWRVVDHEQVDPGSVGRQTPGHTFHQKRVSRCENPPSQHYIGWLIMQIEPIVGCVGEQEHLLCQTLHNRPGSSVSCGGDA